MFIFDPNTRQIIGRATVTANSSGINMHTIRVSNNIAPPQPKPEYQTPPMVRPQHQLRFWGLHEDDKRRKAGRLYAAGWHGVTLTYYSAHEKARIDEFLFAIPQHKWQLLDRDRFDARDDWIGYFRDKQLCYWFRHEKDLKAFTKMLDAIPPRIHEFLIDPARLTRKLRRQIKDRNWTLVRGEDKTLMSIEDCNEAVLIKLTCCD